MGQERFLTEWKIYTNVLGFLKYYFYDCSETVDADDFEMVESKFNPDSEGPRYKLEFQKIDTIIQYIYYSKGEQLLLVWVFR